VNKELLRSLCPTAQVTRRGLGVLLLSPSVPGEGRQMVTQVQGTLPRCRRAGTSHARIQKTRRTAPFVVHIDQLKMFLGDPPTSWLTEGGGVAIGRGGAEELRAPSSELRQALRAPSSALRAPYSAPSSAKPYKLRAPRSELCNELRQALRATKLCSAKPPSVIASPAMPVETAQTRRLGDGRKRRHRRHWLEVDDPGGTIDQPG